MMSKFRNLLKNRHAVNPIIATLLITVIVVVLAVTSWGFYSGFIGVQTRRASEMISIDTVDFTASKVYVRNTGDAKTTVSSIYVEGTPAWSGTQELTTGQVAGISVTYSWTAGETYRVRVVSETGVVAEGDFTAPG